VVILATVLASSRLSRKGVFKVPAVFIAPEFEGNAKAIKSVRVIALKKFLNDIML
jgi:hypothetical protein